VSPARNASNTDRCTKTIPRATHVSSGSVRSDRSYPAGLVDCERLLLVRPELNSSRRDVASIQKPST
jgi:hypothetical protein